MPQEYFETTAYKCKDCGRIFSCHDPKYLPKYHWGINPMGKHAGTFIPGKMKFVEEWHDEIRRRQGT